MPEIPKQNTSSQSPAIDVVHLREHLAGKEPRVGQTLFVAVDGHAGSGKTTLGTWLAGKLGVSLIQTDDFSNWEHPLDWWPQLIEKVFAPIRDGAKTLSYPRSRWWPRLDPEPVVDLPVGPIMIVEGVSAMRAEFRGFISLNLFVDAPRELCLHRGVERDHLLTGKPRDELRAMWEAWIEQEEQYMRRDDPRSHAEIVIDGTRSLEEQIAL